MANCNLLQCKDSDKLERAAEAVLEVKEKNCQGDYESY